MDEPQQSGIYGAEFKGGTSEYATVRFLHALTRAVRLYRLYPPDNDYVRTAVEDAYLSYDVSSRASRPNRMSLERCAIIPIAIPKMATPRIQRTRPPQAKS